MHAQPGAVGLSLATQTKRLKFGCAFNVLPIWHPVRLAEDYAMADIVTDGRVIMGVGRGYHSREVETFGAPLIDAERTAILRGAAAAHVGLFNRSTGVQGQDSTCPPTSISRLSAPRHHHGAAAEHLPVEIWMPIASGKTIDMIAK